MDVSAPARANGEFGTNIQSNISGQSTALSSDFETFLKMLTTQMQNQDPLNPVDSADFAVQLATFSTVEQQVRTNDLLSSLNATLDRQSASKFASWIGMEANADMELVFNGSPVTLTVRPDPGAVVSELVIRNSDGAEVYRDPLDAALTELEWAGVDKLGNPLPPGSYTATTESFANGRVTDIHAVEVHGTIAETRFVEGQPYLVMDGGQRVLAENILALRALKGPT